MLLILFVYYFVQGASIDASPIPSINNRSLAANYCTDLAHCRTIWSIIWSCHTTVFFCTWVAVHPNIPCQKMRKANSWIKMCISNPSLSFVGHRFPEFVCALLVPGYVLTCAIRQFLRARGIAKSELDYIFANSNCSKQLIVRTRIVDDARVLYHHKRIPPL